jgi:hypothetical protein
MALLMISTTLLLSQASGRNIGTFLSSRAVNYREICVFQKLECHPIEMPFLYLIQSEAMAVVD